MMETKLTLSMEKELVEQAKQYARSNGTSLSGLIKNYLRSITGGKEEKTEITPLVSSLSGVLNLNEEDAKKGYTDYLANKYK